MPLELNNVCVYFNNINGNTYNYYIWYGDNISTNIHYIALISILIKIYFTQ